MNEDTTTTIRVWAVKHRNHRVLREGSRSIRCATCGLVTWGNDSEEADRVYAAMTAR